MRRTFILASDYGRRLKSFTSIFEKINILKRSKYISMIFHTLIYCLCKELKDCNSVLDLGCGPSSPLQYCNNVNHSIGVESYKPYLNISKKKNIHTKYLNEDILKINFPKNSFDAVIMIEVLEHLSKQDGEKMLHNAEKWARNKVIVSTPNGFFPMGKIDDNINQRHLSGWKVSEFSKRGFKCRGLAGLKFFYCQNNQVKSLIKENDNLFLNMRFKPKKIAYLITAVSQILAYFIPKYSFEIFAVKEK